MKIYLCIFFGSKINNCEKEGIERIISGDHGMESGHEHHFAWRLTLQHRPEAELWKSDLIQTQSQVLKITRSPQHWAKPNGPGNLTVICHNIKGYHLIAHSEGISALHLCQCSINVLKLASIFLADLLLVANWHMCFAAGFNLYRHI